MKFTLCLAVLLFSYVATQSANLLAKPVHRFSTDLLKEVNRLDDKNIFFSPFSILVNYGMVLLGSEGTTEHELMHVLPFHTISDRSEVVHDTFKEALMDYRMVESGKMQRNVSLKIGNLALVADRFPVRQEYTQHLLEKYLSTVANENFADPEVMNRVNKWVSSKTNGKISKLLEEPIDPSTVLALINTVYFKGSWKTPFNPSKTRQDTFTNIDSSQSEVPFMESDIIKVKFVKNPDKKYLVLELPYEGEFSMVVLLPDEGRNLQDIVNDLNEEDINYHKNREDLERCIVFMPKFEFSLQYDLKHLMSNLGLRSPYGPGANFNKISYPADIYISKSIHQANIQVDEEGATAAAATFTGFLLKMAAPGFVQYIRINRPFLFWLKDNLNDNLLFLGAVKQLP